jgi:ATP-binding cassette subfamily F protein 3
MLAIKNIAKSFGAETLFSDVNFNLNPGDRLGAIGPNGCGKSTLLRILAGQEKADHGSVTLSPPHHIIGYLPQGGLGSTSKEAGGAATFARFLSPVGRDEAALEKELERLAIQIAAKPDAPDIQEAYDTTLREMQDAVETAGRAPAVLAALGLSALPADFPVERLSGGQQTRLALARILLSRPQVLLLDEPTNHLDIAMLDWLEGWLNASPCAVLYISHDRRFLERTATGIVEFEPLRRRVRVHALGYGEYLALKSAETDEQARAYSDQQEEIARLKAAARRLRDTATFSKGGKTDDRDKFAKGFFANRSLGTVGRAKNIEKKIQAIQNGNALEKPRRELGLKIEFQENDARSREVLELRDLSVGYGANVLLSGINRVLQFGCRAALIGANGCGKSTLLRTISGELPALAGEARPGASVKMGVLGQISAACDREGHPLSEIQSVTSYNETEARAFLAYYLFQGDAVFTPLSALSYGEQSRLALAKLVAGGSNFLLLDEPLNHLDIPARVHMERAIIEFPGTVLFVVHDRAFIERVATEVWEIREGRLALIK